MSENPNTAWMPAIRTFIEQATDFAAKSGEFSQVFLRPHTPYFDPTFDAKFVQLDTYQVAADVLNGLESVQGMYGVAGDRLALEILYEYFAAAPSLEMHRPTFDSVLGLCHEELATPNWRYVDFGILQCFHSDLETIEVATGVLVCLRTPQAMPAGITAKHLEWLQEDAVRGAHGHYALVVEHLEPKTPGNVIGTNSFHTYAKTARVLLAMRLLKAGHVGAGRSYCIRPAFLPANLPGQTSIGETRSRLGAIYNLCADDVPRLRSLYAVLLEFETNYQTGWKNVGVALRRFSDVFENDERRPDDQLIDAMIAIEALVGTDQEITHKLSSRVAGLLGGSDDDRLRIYRLIKGCYGVRSTLVHGGDLKQKEVEFLSSNDELMDLVRRLLVAFLHLATGKSRFNSKKALEHSLDAILLSASVRSDLRQAMGLS